VPKITIDGKEYDKSLVPYDASGYGEERALTRAQEDYTLERMGWFPSGVLVLRDSREEGKKILASCPDKNERTKPSSVFEEVVRRHDNWQPLDLGGDHHRIRVVKGTSLSFNKGQEAAFIKIDMQRRAATSKAGITIWQMLAKRHSLGDNSIRPQDRFYLVFHRESPFSIYCFFGRAHAVAKAIDVLTEFDTSQNNSIRRVLCVKNKELPMTASFDELQRRGLINEFDVVQLLDATTALPPESELVTQSSITTVPSPLIDEKAKSMISNFPLTLKFENRTIQLPGLDPNVHTVSDLRQSITNFTNVSPEEQKLLCKGADKLNTDSDLLLQNTALKPNATIIVLRRAPTATATKKK